MKRLKYYLLNMRPASETYEEIYEGRMCESFMDKDPIVHNHALYWDGEIGYEITKSNRLAEAGGGGGGSGRAGLYLPRVPALCAGPE